MFFSNLTISGAAIKVNATTRLHIMGCLFLKNNSRLTIAKSAFKNHARMTFMDYLCVDGNFIDIVYTEDSLCRQQSATYNGGLLIVTFVDPCADKTAVSGNLTAIFVIIGIVIAVGGALFYFVKNRKRQEKMSLGLRSN